MLSFTPDPLATKHRVTVFRSNGSVVVREKELPLGATIWKFSGLKSEVPYFAKVYTMSPHGDSNPAVAQYIPAGTGIH